MEIRIYKITTWLMLTWSAVFFQQVKRMFPIELKNLSAIQGDTEQETPTNKKGCEKGRMTFLR